jgi:hypothetical protein
MNEFHPDIDVSFLNTDTPPPDWANPRRPQFYPQSAMQYSPSQGSACAHCLEPSMATAARRQQNLPLPRSCRDGLPRPSASLLLREAPTIPNPFMVRLGWK